MSLKDFKILQKLGAGAYSVVHKVKRKDDGKVYALKKVILWEMTGMWRRPILQISAQMP